MPDETAPARHVSTLQELLGEIGIALLSIHPYKLTVERHPEFGGDALDTIELNHRESVRWATSNDRLGVRLISEFEIPDTCELTVDMAAEYRIGEPIDLGDKAAEDFINQVAVLAIWPYTRAAAADLVSRVANIPVTLPMIGVDEFEIRFGEPN